MPIAEVELPDGRVVELEVDRGVTPEQVTKYVSDNMAQFGQKSAPTVTELQAEETGPVRSALVGIGRGLTTMARGVGLMDPETPFERQSMEDLSNARPYSFGAGEIVGEAAIPAAVSVLTGGIGGKLAQTAIQAGIGAAEGGVIASGKGQDIGEASALGGGIALGAETLFPVIGRLGGSLIRKVTGKAPRGALIDAAGKPTQELTEALKSQGMTFEDLTSEAVASIAKRPGAVAEQVARQARAESLGVPLSKGEITQDFTQLSKENVLFGGREAASDPFRQFKLKQSEAVESLLENLSGAKGVRKSEALAETGEKIKDALLGDKNLLRSRKNELYGEVAEMAKSRGGVPVFADDMAGVAKGADFEDLRITSPEAIRKLEGWLSKFGIMPGAEAPEILSLANVERFRKGLNAIAREDSGGAAKGIIGKLTEALDGELDQMTEVLAPKFPDLMPPELVGKLKEARATVREMKTVFTDKDLAGKLIALKPDNFTNAVEASKVYDLMVRKSTPVESLVRTTNRLRAGGKEGREALEALRSTVILDLMDAGFSTKSRTVDGINIFNPVAFKKRLANIGEDRIAAIFTGAEATLGKLRNIDKLAQDLIPPERAVPKGSADYVMPLLRRLIPSGGPVGSMILSGVEGAASGIKTRSAVKTALKAEPDLAPVQKTLLSKFPGLASAIGVTMASPEGDK